jgi:hypothetical protein
MIDIDYRINSFADAEARYNETKPVSGATTPKVLDIRPIGKRRNKWDRVAKVTDDCYMLSDGFHDWGYVNNHAGNGCDKATGDRLTLQVEKAPIVWCRAGDMETVTLVNNPRNSTSTTRWEFLNKYLPRGLYLERKNPNQHYIKYNLEMFVFPRETQHGSHPITLIRKIGGLKWEQIGTKYISNNRTVDKTLKTQFKPIMDEYYAWLSAIAPILDAENYNRGDLSKEIGVALCECSDSSVVRVGADVWHFLGFSYWTLKHLPNSTTNAHAFTIGEVHDFFRNVLADVSNPNRLLVAKLFLSRSCLNVVQSYSEATPKLLRSQFNVWVNKHCGFIQEESIAIEMGEK